MTFDNFIKHPIFIISGLIGGICSIIGIPLAFHLAISSPELTYFYTDSNKMQILNKFSTTGLIVSHKDLDETIKDDLSIIQVYIWNEGRCSITPNLIRDTLKIKTDSSIKILEASIIKNTFEKSLINIDEKNKLKGEISLSFDLLESNEGIAIQLLFIGNKKVDFYIKGKIVGQKSIRQTIYNIWGNQFFYYVFRFLFILFIILFSISFLIFLISAILNYAIKNRIKALQITKSISGKISKYSIIIIIMIFAYIIIMFQINKD
jgi:hypothetical protein